MSKLSVQQALAKGKSYAKAGKVDEAKALYAAILQAFPNNTDAQKGLAALSDGLRSGVKKHPPQLVLDNLMSLYKQGKLETVVEKAKHLTVQYPKAINLWNLLGASAAQLGALDLALQAFKRITTLDPNQAVAHFNMGNVLKDQGKLEEAIKAYNRTLAIKPDYEAAVNNIVVALKSLGKNSEKRIEEALKTYNVVQASRTEQAFSYFKRADDLQAKGELKDAINAYSKALAIKPDIAEAYNNMAAALAGQGHLEEALETYSKAINIKPDYTEAYNNMGIALKDQGKLEEAVEAYTEALAIKPDYAEAYNNMAAALADNGKLEEALAAYSKAINIKPDYAEAYNNMGISLKNQGKLEEAIEAYNKALAIKPDHLETHRNLSFALLNDGRLKDGLDEYEWRLQNFKCKSLAGRKFPKPMWDGEKALTGKNVLLWCEQGVGDTVNWVSRLPLISAQADHCILECNNKLVPLMARSFPNIEVKPEDRGNDENRNDFDYHLPLGSLYRHFVPEILKDTKPDAFLLPNPKRVAFWTKRLRSLGEGPYVGVSWKSANMSSARLPNYASIAEWSPIFTIPGVKFINLQYVGFADDLAEVKKQFGVTVHNFDDLDHYDDLDNVAALCAALDVVVSTKITVPLISAGVGTLTKLANWKQSSWNNMLLNPVGPSVDIFEKNTWEPWSGLFDEIARDIKTLKSEKTAN